MKLIGILRTFKLVNRNAMEAYRDPPNVELERP